MDLLVCRNTLMYFNAEVQARVLTRFHYALNDNGYLFLGKAEMALSTGRLFAPVDSRLRIFLKVPGINVRERIIALGPPAEPAAPPDLTARERLRAMAYEAAPGAEIMVDYSGHLALFNSQARSLSGLGAKDLEQPLQNLDVSHSPAELKPLIQKAIADRQPVTVRNLEYSPREGPVQYLDLEVKPLFGGDDQPLGAGLTFMDASRSHGFLEEIQRTRQEQETASEELQSSNEELRTMNDELRQRTDDLNQTHGFMESILSGVRVGIIVVDPDLKVILWNEGAKELWGLGAEEVRGKSLLDLDIGLPVDKLVEPIKASLTEAGLFKRILVDAVNRRGRPFKCRVTLTGSLGPKLERRGLVLVMEEE
jgi:two-component system CheB/CheR fusion protein